MNATLQKSALFAFAVTAWLACADAVGQDLSRGGAASGSSVQPPEASARWSIIAGPVNLVPGNPVRAEGTFEIRATPGAVDRDLPPVTGGACLVANLVPFGIGRATCQTNADCNGPDAIDAEADSRLVDYAGYCAARDGSGEPSTCWTRPGPASTHCRRTVDTLQIAEGEYGLGPVSGDPLGNAPPWPEWAVYACTADPGFPGACGEIVSPNRRISLTPPPGAAE